jgi:hypothetical protein
VSQPTHLFFLLSQHSVARALTVLCLKARRKRSHRGREVGDTNGLMRKEIRENKPLFLLLLRNVTYTFHAIFREKGGIFKALTPLSRESFAITNIRSLKWRIGYFTQSFSSYQVNALQPGKTNGGTQKMEFLTIQLSLAGLASRRFHLNHQQRVISSGRESTCSK